MKEFLTVLKLLRKRVILEPALEAKINQMTINFSYMHLMYQHFSKLCSMVHFAPSSSQPITQKSDYSKTLKSTAWLIFVLLSSRACNRGRLHKYPNLIPMTINMMVHSLAFVLKYSDEGYTIHFTLMAGGDEEAVIPGISKVDMEPQIVEYLCKQLRFVNDEETEQARQQFYIEFKKIQEELELELQDIVECIGDPAKADKIFQALTTIYKKHSSEDEIDETIFFTDNRVGNRDKDSHSTQVYTLQEPSRGQLSLRKDASGEQLSRSEVGCLGRKTHIDNHQEQTQRSSWVSQTIRQEREPPKRGFPRFLSDVWLA